MPHPISETDVSSLPDPLPGGLTVLDVREQDEWDSGHIEGALHVALMEVPRRLAEIPRDQPVLVVCRVGARSAQATGFLQAQGLDAVNLVGGMRAWERGGRPMVATGGEPPTVT